MSVDTRGLVITDCKDVFAVTKKVGAALGALFREGQTHWDLVRGNTSVMASFEISPSIEMVTAVFKYKGEDRALHMHFDCDCDIPVEYGEHGLILSIGKWGSAELIMRTVLAGLQDLGPTYIDVDDCDGEGYVPINQTAAA